VIRIQDSSPFRPDPRPATPTPGASPNPQVTWLCEWLDLGVLRLLAPVLVWSKPGELKANEVLRLGASVK